MKKDLEICDKIFDLENKNFKKINLSIFLNHHIFCHNYNSYSQYLIKIFFSNSDFNLCLIELLFQKLKFYTIIKAVCIKKFTLRKLLF